MSGFRGITWDHPRGHDALAAAAALDPDLDLTWDVQPLEGFESHPIDDLAARYDLLVLDHPHLGEALATGSLLPLDDLVGAAEVARLEAGSIGPSLRSYVLRGQLWALPLDAATQVCAVRPDLADAPTTWDDVVRAAREVPVALSLPGPHALMTFFSACVAFGAEPALTPDALVDRATGLAVLELLTELAAHVPAGTAALNPIGLLGRMTSGHDVALCPLVYGYVTYSTPAVAHPVDVHDAPVTAAGGRPGSTIGGTGIALSARCTPTPELLAHVRNLLSPDVQRGFVPEHAGQPSSRAAWHDDAVNAATRDFYRNTAATLEQSWVRPRHDGYIAFQTEASALVRAVLARELTPVAGLDRLDAAHRASLASARPARHAHPAGDRTGSDGTRLVPDPLPERTS